MDSHLLDDAVGRFPHIARDWAEAELLSAWPQAVLAGREAQAAASLSASRRVAAVLARATGDRFLQDAVSAIDRARDTQRVALATAHQTFGQAMAKYQDDARSEAMRLFEQAFKPLERAGSPFALWTQLQFAIGAYFNSDLGGASVVLSPIAPAAERADYIRLLGLTLRMRGLLQGVRGQFPEQLTDNRLALRAFERARDPESIAAIHASMAENMDNLGEPQWGWFHRTAALAGLADVRRFRRRQAMLLVSAGACLQQGLPYAAWLFRPQRLRTHASGIGPAPLPRRTCTVPRPSKSLACGHKPWPTFQRRRYGSRDLAPIPSRRVFAHEFSSLPERFNNKRSRLRRLPR